MQPSEQLRGLLEQLLTAHAKGLQALAVGTPVSTQRAAAKRLSAALQAAASSTELWDALVPAEPVTIITADGRALTAHERAELRSAIANAAVGFPWADLLEPIGYQPPPSIDEWDNAFAEAITDPRDGDVNREGLAGEFRDFAQRLDALSEDPNSTPKRLRRGIWGAVKKVGSAAVGIAVSAAAAPYVLPAATMIAAVPALAALGLTAGVASDVLIEAGKGAVVKVFQKIKKPPRRQEIPGHPAFVALGLADYISEPALLGLRRAWIDRYDEGDRVIATKAFIRITGRRIAAITARAVGTPWFSEQANRNCRDVVELLGKLETALSNERPCRADIVTILGQLAQRVVSLKSAMRQCISPIDPEEAHAAAIAACEQLVTELDSDIASAGEQAGPAQTNLNLAQRANPPDSIKVAACQSILDECTAVKAALTQLRTDVAAHCAQLKGS